MTDHGQGNSTSRKGPTFFEGAARHSREWAAVATGTGILILIWLVLLRQFLNLAAEPEAPPDAILQAKAPVEASSFSLPTPPHELATAFDIDDEPECDQSETEVEGEEGEGESWSPEDELLGPYEIPSAHRVAIIMDDLGYGSSALDDLLQLKMALTVSIIPHLPLSEECAQRALAANFEVMLHLPMETEELVPDTEGRIVTTMTEQEMRASFEDSIRTVPNVSGVNNHQGSRLTEDPEAMRRVLSQVKRYGFYFVDSRTNSHSVAERIAREMEIPTASNNLFLDNEKDFDYICEKLEALVQRAKRRGKAIGICHIHPETVRALHAMLPRFAEEKVELVYASQIVEGVPWTLSEETTESESSDELVVRKLME